VNKNSKLVFEARFELWRETLGELVAGIYRTLWEYNHTRIHSALKMPPSVFAEKIAA
jgi:hypothetical protein